MKTQRLRGARVWAALAAGALIVGLLGTTTAGAQNPNFPAANGNIAFGVDGSILVMGPDGENLRTLNENGYGGEWSPDGRKIATTRDMDGDPNTWTDAEIFVMNANGTGVRQLTDSPVMSGEPSWSPDGKGIVFVRQGLNDDTEIYTMKADGTDLRRLTDNVVTDRYPDWSPDGTKIVFQSRPYPGPDAPIDLFTMNPDGTGRQALTTTVSRDEFAPDWSPDGNKIAFVGVDRSTQEGGIFTRNADGTSETYVARGDDPAWSPDGSKIAFTGGGNYSGIYTVNTDGTDQRRLTTIGAAPSWAPLLGSPIFISGLRAPIFISDLFTGTVTAHDIQDGVPRYVYYSGRTLNRVPQLGYVRVAGMIQVRPDPLPRVPFQMVGMVVAMTQVSAGFATFPSGEPILGYTFDDLTGIGWARGLNPEASRMDGAVFWPSDLPKSGDYTWTTYNGSDAIGAFRLYIEP